MANYKVLYGDMWIIISLVAYCDLFIIEYTPYQTLPLTAFQLLTKEVIRMNMCLYGCLKKYL